MKRQGDKLLIIITVIGLFGFLIGIAGGNSIKNDLVIKPAQEEVIRFVGDKYFVICSSNNGSHVKWYDPYGKLAPELKGRVHTETKTNAGAGSQALYFEHISIEDKGDWACRSDTGAEDKIVKMIVHEPISFADTPATQMARENADFLVTCLVKGDPPPTVSWYFNYTLIDLVSSNKYKKVDKGLNIKNVTLNDKGEYICKAFQVTPTISNVEEHIIQLNVQHKPFPVKKLPHHAKAEQAYGYILGTVNLTCEAKAEPAANFTWHRNGKPIAKSSGRIFEDTHVSVLEVPIPDRSALGDYMCKARNFMGTMERIITLIEGQRPDPPSEIVLRGVNLDFIDIEVSTPPQPTEQFTVAPQPDNLPIIGYRFQYMPLPLPVRTEIPKSNKKTTKSNDVIEEETTIAPKPEITEESWKNASFVDKGVAEGTTYIISNLQHDTPYIVRAMSRNAAGFSTPSAVLQFHTLRLQPYSVFGNPADENYDFDNTLRYLLSINSNPIALNHSQYGNVGRQQVFAMRGGPLPYVPPQFTAAPTF